MRPRTLLVSILVLTALPTAAARAQEGTHQFGAGIMVGDPIGLSAKYYLMNRQKMALAAGLGEVEHRFDDDGLHLHLDVLWHPVALTRQPSFNLGLHVGVGGRLLFDDEDCDRNGCYDDDDTHVGARVPFGLTMDFFKVHLDVFFELAMVVDFLIIDNDDRFDGDDDDRVNLNAALGVRYYF